MRKAQDKQEIATLQAEFAMMAAQLAAIRKLEPPVSAGDHATRPA